MGESLLARVARALWMSDYPYQDRALVDQVPLDQIPPAYVKLARAAIAEQARTDAGNG